MCCVLEVCLSCGIENPLTLIDFYKVYLIILLLCVFLNSEKVCKYSACKQYMVNSKPYIVSLLFRLVGGCVGGETEGVGGRSFSSS